MENSKHFAVFRLYHVEVQVYTNHKVHWIKTSTHALLANQWACMGVFEALKFLPISQLSVKISAHFSAISLKARHFLGDS